MRCFVLHQLAVRVVKLSWLNSRWSRPLRLRRRYGDPTRLGKFSMRISRKVPSSASITVDNFVRRQLSYVKTNVQVISQEYAVLQDTFAEGKISFWSNTSRTRTVKDFDKNSLNVYSAKGCLRFDNRCRRHADRTASTVRLWYVRLIQFFVFDTAQMKEFFFITNILSHCYIASPYVMMYSDYEHVLAMKRCSDQCKRQRNFLSLW